MAKTATVREQLEETESTLVQTCEALKRAKKALVAMKERASTLERGLLEAQDGRQAEQDVLVAMQDACQEAHLRHLQDLSTIEQLADALRRVAGGDQSVATSPQVSALLTSLPIVEVADP